MTGLKSFDRVAAIYDETRGMPPEVMTAVAGRLAAVLRETSPAPRVVEVGVGTGRIAVPLAERGVRVVGYDIAPRMLAVLRAKRRDIDVMLAEAAHPPLRDAAFDAAVFAHVLHLVPDVDATLRAALRLVRPGGLALLAGDDYVPSGFHSGLQEIFRATLREAAGFELPPFERTHTHPAGKRFREAVAAAGGSVEFVELGRYDAVNSARREYERTETRCYSGLWAVPTERFDAILALYRPRLEAFFGSFDREVTYERVVTVAVGRLPAG
ncbi:MAG TPA: class I SAM-dependent methyltransferase [Dehalococcoidia bacterium]|nr:class I SAM-dependent methyltransferase [Dehalococcoidia bacterium]